MARAIGSCLAGSNGKARLLILMYHRILLSPDPLMPDIPDASTFDWQMALLAQVFRPLPLDEAVANLRAGTLPARSVCVTFDDGYADNLTVALPILRRHRVPATVFVAPGFLDGGCMWNDAVIEILRDVEVDRLDLTAQGLDVYPVRTWEQKRKVVEAILGKLKYFPQEQRDAKVRELNEMIGLPARTDLMLTSAQVRALRQAGIGIGAHTMSHPILTKTPDDVVKQELADSKAHLEALLGETVELFAYPNGNPDTDYALRHVSAVRAAGFKAAVSVSWGYADAGADCYQLPRIWPWDRTPSRFALRLWRTYLGGPARLAAA